jgi:uncharacterized protein YmfQ (DUF2313 family)
MTISTAAAAIDDYKAQLAAWTDRHADTPVIKRYRPGTHTLIDYYEADHADALHEDQKRTAAAAAQRSLDEVEQFATRMARFPDHEDRWAVERIRIIAEAGYLDDGAALRQIRNVLAGLDLAEQRRRVDR